MKPFKPVPVTPKIGDVPIINSPTTNAFGIVSKPFKDGPVSTVVGGIGLAAIMANAMWVGLVIGGVATIIMAGNAIVGMYDKDITKYLSEEPGDVKQKA